MYDERPRDMVNYLRHYGYHFNKKMCDWAVSQVRRKNPSSGKMEPIEPWSKEKVDELMKRYGLTLENDVLEDARYVLHMAVADFFKSSLKDEASLAQFVKDYVDDADQADGFIFNRFYADCLRNGQPIEWSEML